VISTRTRMHSHPLTTPWLPGGLAQEHTKLALEPRPDGTGELIVNHTTSIDYPSRRCNALLASDRAEMQWLTESARANAQRRADGFTGRTFVATRASFRVTAWSLSCIDGQASGARVRCLHTV
jgi:hypothetical protein